MATPDIGSTISEAYSKGLDRIGPWAPALLVVGLGAGVIGGVLSEVQSQVAPDAEDVFRAVFSGDRDGLDSGDFRTFTIIGAVGTAIQLLITFVAYALFSGRAHRERHGLDAGEQPNPGTVVPQLLGMLGQLTPKLFVLVGALLLAQVLGAFPPIGPLLGVIVYVFAIMVWVRWIYAWVIAGSGEATGDAAFERSERTVAGSWWGTLGVWIVVGLATLLPVAIAAMIAGAIVPTSIGSTLAATVVQFVLGVPIFASALDSAWAQLEGDGGDVEPRPEDTEPRRDTEPPADTGGPFV